MVCVGLFVCCCCGVFFFWGVVEVKKKIGGDLFVVFGLGILFCDRVLFCLCVFESF